MNRRRRSPWLLDFKAVDSCCSAENARTRALEKQNTRLSVLYEVALAVGGTLDLKAILDKALDRIISFMGVDSGVIYVINEDTLEMIPVVFRNLSDDVVRDLCENRVKVGECMCGTIAQCSDEVIIPRRASDDERFSRAALKREGMEFYAGLPIMARGNVVGVICVINHKPYQPEDELLDILRAATVPLGLAIENARIFEEARRRADLQSRFLDFEGIVAASEEMRGVLDLVRKVTDVRSSILLFGESGTGKELIARALHSNSRRKDLGFLTVNCAAVPETLLESEFFGYERGAFTGAEGRKKGLFEAADGGTIFLDEVEAMSPGLQAKLLRVLQDGSFLKVGSTRPVTVDVRVIAATNRDLFELVKSGDFREDLYYRLNVIRIDIPPLRMRREDIPVLARNFLRRFSDRTGKSVAGISRGAMTALLEYHWPGNVRELQNALERGIAVAETGEIQREDLPPEVAGAEGPLHGDLALETLERNHILRVIRATGGNRKQTAELLGIDKTTLWRKMKRIPELQNAVTEKD